MARNPFDQFDEVPGGANPFDQFDAQQPPIAASPVYQAIRQRVDSVGTGPEWSAQYPNLYGLLGAGKAIARTGIEAGYTALGAAAGAPIPAPGTTLVGGGLGYATGKRVADSLLGDEVDMSAGGIAKDVAIGGLMQGGGKVISAIPGIKTVLAPAAAGVGPENIPGGKALIEKASKSLMEKSMKIPPSVKPGPRETAINTALNEEIPITKGGLARVKGILDDLNDQMDSAVAANPDAPIAIDSVLGPVNELKAWAGNTVNGKALSGKIDAVVKSFKKQYGDTITVAQAQEIKQNTNTFLKKSYGELRPVTEEATKQIVRGLKDRIAQEIPEITGINMRYGNLKTLESALEHAVSRTGNWDWFSLSAGMAGNIAATATGSVEKAASAAAIYRAVKSPYFQSKLALMLHRSGAGPKANVMANAVADSIYNKMTGGYDAKTGGQ